MASVEGAAAVMAKALEIQSLIAERVMGAARIMDQNGVAAAGNPTPEVQADVSSAIAGLGRVLDIIV